MKSVFDFSYDASEELWVSEIGCTIGFGFDARGVCEKGYCFLRFFVDFPFLGGVIWMPISLNFFMKYSSSGSLVFFMFFIPHGFFMFMSQSLFCFHSWDTYSMSCHKRSREIVLRCSLSSRIFRISYIRRSLVG
jgi:hypothetical protein